MSPSGKQRERQSAESEIRESASGGGLVGGAGARENVVEGRGCGKHGTVQQRYNTEHTTAQTRAQNAMT